MWLQAGVYPLVCWSPPQCPVFFSLGWNFSFKDTGCYPNPTQLIGFCLEGRHLPLSNAGSVFLGRWTELLPVVLTQRREEDPSVAGGPSKIDPPSAFLQQNWTVLSVLPHGHSFSFLAPSFCCLLFLITTPYLPTDLQASCQVPLPEAGACSLACCCLLVGHELWTVELTHRITTGGHCWTLTNITNTPVVAAGLFFKFTLIKISLIFKT